MRPIRALLPTLAAAIAFSASTGCARQPDLAVVTQEILARERASFAAWQRKDKAFYEDYWADDMTEFLPDSPTLVRKAEEMPHFDELATRWQIDSIEILTPEVRLYGDVALLTYNEKVAGKYDGKPSTYTGKVSMVYVKQGGRWRGVHYHESK
jgi:ketosteroid isomerase-like protein